ncbi:non-hydrolyzing UDP-N-acetylglucosamine 2-epimerase [Mechercharimyces sp. CAU 1602]|uniref:non-hydrolyzing UDP-N-acetylglucosamine 2-epimerase n=1 Tax=Mechercharimyces sp. CAU 1602 TaxID=2973933 RepID=UPI00216251B5|nr:UDP-N-acetylglucosamine 2-epimerase (non-hydrolyzing) [Mechercharimyces sp. CAU 1602]MCS1352257.1 UDP-N-acetylglucosamine 2-epimerase (non-hydrolyzing) [Mechercharimyces sp. CAU 1602]
MKAVTIVGARPQFIKAAPISRVWRQHGEEILVHTGQHYDHNLSDIFFSELEIPQPDYHLHVGSKSHGEQTGEMLTKIERILLEEKPDLVIVYGDTNSTLAGGLAAAKLHVPVAHVEAGLRSFNRRMPEETNRVLTDHLSTWLFCPTETAVAHLLREGMSEGVHMVGDIMVEAVQYNIQLARRQSTILQQLALTPDQFLLATLHRAENTDHESRLRSIVSALNQIEYKVVLPLHPRTQARLAQWDLQITNPNVIMIAPIGYLDMLQLEAAAAKILTDSGGVQKEAFLLQTPCITMRDETEWVETVKWRANRLVGADERQIVEAAHERSVIHFDKIPPLYGAGRTADQIIHVLAKG